MSEIQPIKFLAPVRFKLSFNTIGNCTSMRNYAEQFHGEWVWLVEATNGINDKLYTEEQLQQAIFAERKRCADMAFNFTASVHIAHDMKTGIFPERSNARDILDAMMRGEA